MIGTRATVAVNVGSVWSRPTGEDKKGPSECCEKHKKKRMKEDVVPSCGS